MKGLGQRIGIKHPQDPVSSDAPCGKSARQRAFVLFDEGRRPSDVARKEDILPRTAYRYFQQWKKLPLCMELQYRLLKAALHGGQVPPERFAEALAEVVQLPYEPVMGKLQRPWGLKRLMARKRENLEKAAIRKGTMARLDAALALVWLYEAKGISPQRVLEALNRLEPESGADGSSNPELPSVGPVETGCLFSRG